MKPIIQLVIYPKVNPKRINIIYLYGTLFPKFLKHKFLINTKKNKNKAIKKGILYYVFISYNS